VKHIEFDFSLNSFYQKGIVERERSIYALYHVTIIMDSKLQHGHVDVHLRLDHKLERFCKSTLRKGTILDVIVLFFAIIISILYILSVLQLIKLLKVCIHVYSLFVM